MKNADSEMPNDTAAENQPCKRLQADIKLIECSGGAAIDQAFWGLNR
jgi:hypothetical protein